MLFTIIFGILAPVQEPCSEPNSICLSPAEEGKETVGRLEVCSGDRWGSVCGKGAKHSIAIVACRELNHAANG